MRPKRSQRLIHICNDCGELLTNKPDDSPFVRASELHAYLGQNICDALGLDASRISRLELVMEAREMPVLKITRLLWGNDCGSVGDVLEQYQLIPIESAQQADFQKTTGAN